MWNLFSVVVFQRSMLNWRRGWGQSAMSTCTFFYMWYLFSVVVFQRSMFDWSRGYVCHGYMCILLYVKLIQCCGFPEIYVQLEEGVGSVCNGYMCILLYLKLIQCSGFPEIYVWLEQGVCLPLVYVHSSICETYSVLWFSRDLCSIGGGGYVWLQYMCILLYVKLIQCCVFHRSMLNWRRGWGQSAMAICAFFYMWNLCSVMVLHRSMVE